LGRDASPSMYFVRGAGGSSLRGNVQVGVTGIVYTDTVVWLFLVGTRGGLSVNDPKQHSECTFAH
jgi:hypothetical protein